MAKKKDGRVNNGGARKNSGRKKTGIKHESITARVPKETRDLFYELYPSTKVNGKSIRQAALIDAIAKLIEIKQLENLAKQR